MACFTPTMPRVSGPKKAQKLGSRTPPRGTWAGATQEWPSCLYRRLALLTRGWPRDTGTSFLWLSGQVLGSQGPGAPCITISVIGPGVRQHLITFLSQRLTSPLSQLRCRRHSPHFLVEEHQGHVAEDQERWKVLQASVGTTRGHFASVPLAARAWAARRAVSPLAHLLFGAVQDALFHTNETGVCRNAEPVLSPFLVCFLFFFNCVSHGAIYREEA